MSTTGYRPSKRAIAVIFGVFMACAIAMLGYQVRLSRLLPEHTSQSSLIKSIKMLHERSVSDVQVEDDGATGEHHTLAIVIVVDGAVPGEEILTPEGFSPLQLNLSPYSGYRRPPPAC